MKDKFQIIRTIEILSLESLVMITFLKIVKFVYSLIIFADFDRLKIRILKGK